MTARVKIAEFGIINKNFAFAVVTFHTMNDDGSSTGVKATIYQENTGTGTRENPQTLDADGKLSADCYVESAVVAAITGINERTERLIKKIQQNPLEFQLPITNGVFNFEKTEEAIAAAGINDLLDNIDSVIAVGNNIAAVVAVDANETNINAVDANATNINTVATNIASVNSAASNMAAIVAAPTEAANAAASAVSSAASAAQAASLFIGTSTTSNSITVASKSFTTQTNKNFQAGQFMTITDAANNANYMFGRVTSYNNATGALVFDSQSVGGSGTKTSWNISVSALSVSTANFDQLYFGNGSDGDVTISSGVTTLTRNMAYNNLTISGTGQLNTQGFAILIKNTLDLTNAPANAIISDPAITAPTNGGNGSLGVAGAAPTGGGATSPASNISLPSLATLSLVAGTIASNVGAYGGNISQVTYFAGYQGTNQSNSGKGGDSPSFTGGTNPGTLSRGTRALFPFTTPAFFSISGGTGVPTTFQGGNGVGCGGAGDGTNGGGGGGGPARSGGFITIYAKNISRGASTAAGAINANCKFAAGNGGSATAGNAGGGGGGTGGSGGIVYLVYSTLSGTSKAGAITANSGAGGNGGNGFGTGGGGNGGASGDAGLVVLHDLTLSTVTSSSEVQGLAGAAASGTTGGAGGAARTLSVTL